MSGEPVTNAAVEWIRAVYALGNVADGPATEFQDFVSPDFSYEGRNVTGVSFGEMTASDWPAFLSTFWEIGVGRPEFSDPVAIAVRGQRCAAITASVDYGNDTFTDFLHCIQLDRGLKRLERIVSFDIDNRDDAIAELDRMHEGLDAASDPPS